MYRYFSISFNILRSAIGFFLFLLSFHPLIRIAVQLNETATLARQTSGSSSHFDLRPAIYYFERSGERQRLEIAIASGSGRT